jgi:hypothetical protein
VRVNQSNTMDFDEQRAIVASSRKAAGTRGDLRRLLAVPRFGARLPQVVSATFPARLPTKQHKAQHPGKDWQYDPRQIYPNLDACRVATCWVRQRSEPVGGRRDFIERERIGWPTLASAVSLPSVARQDQALSLRWRQTPGCLGQALPSASCRTRRQPAPRPRTRSAHVSGPTAELAALGLEFPKHWPSVKRVVSLGRDGRCHDPVIAAFRTHLHQ